MDPAMQRRPARTLSVRQRAVRRFHVRDRLREVAWRRRGVLFLLAAHRGGRPHLAPLGVLSFILAYRIRTRIGNDDVLRIPRIDKRIAHFSNSDCLILFRFEKQDLPRLMKQLQIEPEYELENGGICNGEHAFLFFLHYMAFPLRLIDPIVQRFWGRTSTELGRIVKAVKADIYNTNIHLIHGNLDFFEPRFNDYTRVMANKILSLNNNVIPIELRGAGAIIDAKLFCMCRPSNWRLQRPAYNGRKKVHCFNGTALVFPDGMFGAIHSPAPGRRNDARMLRESNLNGQLAAAQVNRNFLSQLKAILDKAYFNNTHMIAMARAANPAQQAVNDIISPIRVPIEWSFAKMVQLWKYIDYKKAMKLGQNTPSRYVDIAFILTNCHTCLYGSETGWYFQCMSPTLEQYCGIP